MTLRNIRNAFYPLLGVAIILVIWQLYTELLGINRIVLPSPIDILKASAINWHVLLRESWPTFLESVLGFVLAVVSGIPFAVCVASSGHQSRGLPTAHAWRTQDQDARRNHPSQHRLHDGRCRLLGALPVHAAGSARERMLRRGVQSAL